MKRATTFALCLLLATGAFAAPAPQAASNTTAKKKTKTAAPSATSKLDKLEQAVEAQQQQIQQLRQELQSRDQAMQQMQQRLDQSIAASPAVAQAQSKADAAAATATKLQSDVTALNSDVSDLKLNSTNAALSLQETQKNIQSSLESPLALHYKGITITPVGFMAAETVWRQKALGADINTPFNAVPFDGASQANMSEFFGSGRQSRVGMLAEGKLDKVKVTGYVEADFLSAGVTSNNNESNSYTLRQRQVWGQAALNNGWSFTGGQMWSLVTETKKGLDNRTEALPMTIDPQYSVGFSWARQYGFRVTKNFNSKAWFGFSVENSQALLGGHGAGTNFLIGQAGAGGGLYNLNANYSYNPSPDFVAKFAFEPGFGHYEVFGVIRDFRARVFPNAGAATPSAAGAFNNSVIGGGAGANARWTFAKKVDFGIHFLGGDGVGRYGSSTLTDVVARPDGVLVPVRNYQGLATLEYHGKKLDVYSNYGNEYESRTAFGTKNVGYGSLFADNSGCGSETLPTGGFLPGSLSKCNGDTRAIMEGTVGFWYRLYKGPKGTVQWGPQYSYFQRNTWAGKGGSPSATENIFLTSFRYYLP